MTTKPKPPASPIPVPANPRPRSPVVNPSRPADNRSRWQRTVRFGWDKGGAKGGR